MIGLACGQSCADRMNCKALFAGYVLGIGLMELNHVQLLQLQRDLYEIPRGRERFQRYLDALTSGTDEAVLLPLVSMNPMGHEHVAARLDELLAMDADRIAADAVKVTGERLAKKPGSFKHGLVVVHDLRGGWTNRYTTEATYRFYEPRALSRGWLTTLLFVTDAPSAQGIREAVLSSIFRASRIEEHGAAKTLREMLAQEGEVARFAGVEPQLDDQEVAAARETLQPYLDSRSYPVCFAAMFGDEAAIQLGYPPIGLPPWAGFEVASRFDG
jgi:hypothetical protein